MNKTIVIMLVILAVLSGAAYGGNVIKGVFGVEFGQVFDPYTIRTKDYRFHSNPHGDVKSDEDIIYEFIPTIRYRTFSRYFVYVLPITKKIYRIQAQSFDEINSSDVCLEEARLLKSLLIEKYNIKDVTDLTDIGRKTGRQKDDEITLRKNDVIVMLGCDQTNFLNIDYTHYGFSLQLSQERDMAVDIKKEIRKEEIREKILKYGEPVTEGL